MDQTSSASASENSAEPRVALKPTSSKFHRLGRWTKVSSDSGSLVVSWCGASISFRFSGTYLSLRIGPSTERKDSFNGGTPMIACSIHAPTGRSEGSGSENVRIKTYDCEPAQELVLVDACAPIADALPVRVTLTLVDWASVLEVESIIADSEDSIQPLPDDPRPVRVLAIGDSITAGFSDGSHPIPTGCLNAYPHIAKEKVYEKTGIEIELELVAFPGITLVTPTAEELDEGAGQGMIDRYFNASQWSIQPAALDEQPSIIIIALGTNDEAQDVPPDRFASTMQTFIEHLLRTYHASVKHICVLHPFPDFTDCSEPESAAGEDVPITRDLTPMLDSMRLDAAQQVGLHEWNIGKELRREHTMDGLHPTLDGHRVLGGALAQMILPLLS